MVVHSRQSSWKHENGRFLREACAFLMFSAYYLWAPVGIEVQSSSVHGTRRPPWEWDSGFVSCCFPRSSLPVSRTDGHERSSRPTFVLISFGQYICFTLTCLIGFDVSTEILNDLTNETQPMRIGKATRAFVASLSSKVCTNNGDSTVLEDQPYV